MYCYVWGGIKNSDSVQIFIKTVFIRVCVCVCVCVHVYCYMLCVCQGVRGVDSLLFYDCKTLFKRERRKGRPRRGRYYGALKHL